MLILKNATIMPINTAPFVGDIAVNGKTIAKVANSIPASSTDTVYDAKGCYITPGFIDAHAHIGLFEDGMGEEGIDVNEGTNPVTPEMRGLDGINPFDPCFREAYMAGVTTVMAGPGSANVIGGEFVIINTYGKNIDDMVFDTPKNNPAAMKAAMGENPKRVYAAKHASPSTRMATAAIMRKTFMQAREYMAKLESAGSDLSKRPALDMGMEALLPVLRREIPLKIHCHRADDILTAIRIANEFDILFTLDHFTEGYMIIDQVLPEFKKNLKGVIIGPLLCDRGKIETRNLSFKSAKVLYDAGVPFAMMTDSPVIPQMYLPICMSLAIRDGLPEDAAMRAITVNPAKILGIDNVAGTLEAGKFANIAVFGGHPLDVRSRCVMTLINGNIVHNEF